MKKKSDATGKENAQRLPRHVGIIMDGNGRWARKRGKPRSLGHKEGLEAAKRVVKTAADIGLRYLSVFAFSTENWSRTEKEVSYLMFLVKKHLRAEYEFYKANNIRLVYSGDLTGLRRDIAADIRAATEETAHFQGLTLNIVLNYGGRDEIVRAVKRWRKAGQPPLTERNFYRYLDQPTMPDLDLLIRSGGEKRISNFLLWQSSYAELYFSDKLWPDWQGDDLREAIRDFQKRERRFGRVS
ncbi:MAG: di-trans,poly-cis-decaprenylcistransferase [Spirochaetales bacterium]|nr:di-trans,poly-cis-decaprenylcistransferase [Spirochaetales bacterium]